MTDADQVLAGARELGGVEPEDAPQRVVRRYVDEPSSGSIATWNLPGPLLDSAISSEATSATDPFGRKAELVGVDVDLGLPLAEGVDLLRQLLGEG